MIKLPSLRLPALLSLLSLSVLAACAVPVDQAPARLPAELGMTQLAATIQVPGDHATIADALAAATVGDVVSVGAGTWVGDLTLPGGVTLQGAGLDQTIIEGHVVVAGGQAAIGLLNLVGPGAAALSCGVSAGPGNSVLVTAARVLGFYEGICLDPGATSTLPWPEVDRVTVQSNAYGVTVYSGQAEITNNYVVYSNRTGVYGFDDATVLALNNTFLGNSFGGDEADRDAALSLGAGGASVVRNNTVTSNLFGMQCAGCLATWDHNNVWGNTTNHAGDSSASSGDLSVDPLFVSTSAGNLRLLDASPLIDQGSSELAPLHDWDGLSRPSGAGWDIGADEWSLSSYTLVINEVMANPSAESTGEFIEIANVGSEPVELAGLLIGDGDATDTIQAWSGGSTLVPGGGYAVVLDPDYAGQYAIPSGAITVTVGNAKIGNGISTNDPIQLLEGDGYVVIDEWTIPFDPSDGVSVERVDVLAGNVASNWVASSCPSESSPGAINCAAGEIEPSDPSELVITEVLANALNEQTGEFVELWNSGGDDIDLTGLVITDGDSTDGLIAWGGGDTILPGGGYALIVDPNYGGQYLVPGGVLLMTTPDATIGNGIANGSDPVTLLDLDGVTVIDSYSFPTDYGDGYSAEKVDYAAGDDVANWAASSCPIHHSAGRLSCNAGGVGDGLVLAEVMNNPLAEQSGEFLELHNLGPGSIDLAGLWISDGDQIDALIAYGGNPTVVAAGELALVVDSGLAGDFTIPAGIAVMTTGDAHLGNGLSLADPITVYEADGVSVVDTFGSPFNPGNGTSVEKISATAGDTTDNWEASSCASGSSPGLANCVSYTPIPSGTSTLVITEVMSNPLSEATGEYVEVYNDGAAPVDLWGLILYDGDAWDFLRELSGGTTIVAPGEYALILDAGYAGQYTIPAGVTTVTADDATLGSGLATNDHVLLYEADGYSVIDSYSFPFNPGNGVSVERVDLATDDIEANWVQSSCGASPGAVNCAAGAVITACADGVDNDGDGWVDLSDPGCADAADVDESFVGATECSDEVDNDGDGLVDGADPECADPTVVAEGSPCGDGVDNDSDGWTDLDDPDCASSTQETGLTAFACNDGLDNDGDGGIDAADADCADGFAAFEEAPCADGLDNDGDGWTDGDDLDCDSSPFEEVGLSGYPCNDGVDNNGDGLVDTDDPECWNADGYETAPMGAVVVTEIMGTPFAVPDADGEWFEIYNTLSVDIELEGWNFYDGGGDFFDIEGSLVVPSGGYAVLAVSADPTVNGGVVPDYVYDNMVFDDIDDELYIDDPTATENGFLEWDENSGWPDSDGESVSLSGALTPSQSLMYNEANWCPSTTVWPASLGDAGSPGQANEVCP
jgi:hypothetical protein